MDLAWFLYLHPVRSLTTHGSPALMNRLARSLETGLQILTAGQKRRVARRVAEAVERGAMVADPQEVARRAVSHWATQLVDDLALSRPDAKPRSHAAVHGLPHLESALARGKGVMIVSGHFYANRTGKRHLAGMGYPILSVRDGRLRYPGMSRVGGRLLQPYHDRFLHQVVQDEVLLQEPGFSLTILKRLRAGGLVDLHLDGSRSGETAWCPFLGTRWRFPTGFLEIARLSGCSVVPMLCVGGSRELEVSFEEPVRLEYEPDRSRFVAANLLRLVGHLESQIARHPDQWEYWAVREDLWIAGRG
jgi:KDO2-lipid IV(A) lauroyltransferase